jgi:hypothetical protein
MTPGCDRDTLLYEFRDNNTQAINASSMRLFVNCVYDNFLDLTKIVDNSTTYDPLSALSANQGAILSDKLNSLENSIINLQNLKADKSDVYSKIETDSFFYSKTECDENFYYKNEVYNKQDIDSILSSIEQRLIALDNRITNIVNKNNLEE